MTNYDFIQSIFLKGWRPYAWLALLIIIVFSQTLFFDYVYLDDNALILEQSQHLTNWENLPQTFQEDAFHKKTGANSYYRPLLTISFMLDAHINGTASPLFFHLTNIILHLLTTIFLFILLKTFQVKRKWAFLTSIIFALHPITLQTTAFIAGRNDSLLAVFLIPAFITSIHAIKKNNIYWWVASIPLYTASLFTKETAIVFLPLMIIYLFLFKHKKIEWLHYIWLGGVYIGITGAWLHIRSLALNNLLANQMREMLSSILENSISIISYIGKIFIPVNISVLPIAKDLPLIYGIISIIILGLLIYFAAQKNKNILIFGFSWFILLLLPGLIQHTLPFPNFSEHRVYIPMIGLALALNSLNFKNKLPKITIIIAITTIILTLAIANLLHAQVYKNKTTFWTNAVQYSPSSAFNHNNLGAMYYLDGKYNLAEQEWLKATKLNPNEPLVNNNLGLIYDAQGEYAKAYNSYLKELQINPEYSNAHFNLGLLLYKTNNIDQAIAEWQKTIKLDPDYFAAYKYLAEHYYNINDLEQAKYYTNQIIERGGTISQEFLNTLYK